MVNLIKKLCAKKISFSSLDDGQNSGSATIGIGEVLWHITGKVTVSDSNCEIS